MKPTCNLQHSLSRREFLATSIAGTAAICAAGSLASLAEASLRLQKPAEAEEAAKRAIQLKYFLVDAHFVLARALVAQNKWEAAREIMTGLLQLQPDNRAVAGYRRRLERQID